MFLSPKQVADALSVSESTVKRWCDSGKIQAQYTEGGHRRIGGHALMKYLRESGTPLVHPDILRIPDVGDETSDDGDYAFELTANLLDRNEQRCREIISELYLSGQSIVLILEQVIAAAMHRIGDLWACGTAEIYQERRSTEIAIMLINDLRRLLPAPEDSAPLAIGGAASGDMYRIPTLMVETVLRDAGWNAVSLGENLPLSSFGVAIERLHPTLFWLSVSYIEDEAQFVKDYTKLYEKYGSQVAFVIGGQAITPALLEKLRYFAHCESLERLLELSATLRSFTKARPSTALT